ncbi:V-type proton ATPase subunit G-like [Centruroides vittatus]|uniref:V-type proton ATPase subunit G-like n=1 Tax=Centruroides sculpturatus TaxID=218467 RepID=UPI000C6D734E|nr:V-type proton ATPase subunit G-like [Centruroides sculpturatus]
MASQTQGIQQLLAAEKRAAEKVAEARKRKATKLKQAKEEAQREIERIREEREREFKKYEEKHMGSREDIATKIEADTRIRIEMMNKAMNVNKDKVIEHLLTLVCDIKPDVHRNLKLTNVPQ